MIEIAPLTYSIHQTIITLKWMLYLVYIETDKTDIALYVTGGHMPRLPKSVAQAECLSGKLKVP